MKANKANADVVDSDVILEYLSSANFNNVDKSNDKKQYEVRLVTNRFSTSKPNSLEKCTESVHESCSHM